jgi:DnaJ-class molecular chaperone
MGCERCPVCHGKGIVPNGFYSSTEKQWNTTSASPEQCRSCSGSGIVWNVTIHLLSNIGGK